MATIFCCTLIQPYRPQRLDHESKFVAFRVCADFPKATSVEAANAHVLSSEASGVYVIQIVQQVNYGPLESKRYFVRTREKEEPFAEVIENDLIEANFAKVNSYKNFKRTVHDKFFEPNLYQKDPVNKHHWRANIARPAGEMDL